MFHTSRIFFQWYYYLIYGQVKSISIYSIISHHLKRIISNNAEKFDAFSFYITCYIHYKIIRTQETHHVSSINNLCTSTLRIMTETYWPSWLGLQNTLTASLQRGKTPQTSVLNMILNNLMERLQYWGMHCSQFHSGLE